MYVEIFKQSNISKEISKFTCFNTCNLQVYLFLTGDNYKKLLFKNSSLQKCIISQYYLFNKMKKMLFENFTIHIYILSQKYRVQWYI